MHRYDLVCQDCKELFHFRAGICTELNWLDKISEKMTPEDVRITKDCLKTFIEGIHGFLGVHSACRLEHYASNKFMGTGYRYFDKSRYVECKYCGILKNDITKRHNCDCHIDYRDR